MRSHRSLHSKPLILGAAAALSSFAGFSAGTQNPPGNRGVQAPSSSVRPAAPLSRLELMKTLKLSPGAIQPDAVPFTLTSGRLKNGDRGQLIFIKPNSVSDLLAHIPAPPPGATTMIPSVNLHLPYDQTRDFAVDCAYLTMQSGKTLVSVSAAGPVESRVTHGIRADHIAWITANDHRVFDAIPPRIHYRIVGDREFAFTSCTITPLSRRSGR